MYIIDKENFKSLTNASKIVRAAVVVRFTRDVTEARLIILESTAAAILTHATIDVKTRDVTNWHSAQNYGDYSPMSLHKQVEVC